MHYYIEEITEYNNLICIINNQIQNNNQYNNDNIIQKIDKYINRNKEIYTKRILENIKDIPEKEIKN